jgi:tetratricopeptide (TPR) repeat protein
VVRYWNNYGFADDFQSQMSDDTRMNVALSFWKTGDADTALSMIQRYLKPEEVPKYSDMAMDMAVNISIEQQAWHRIADLVSMATEHWSMDDRQRRQLQFAQAMSLENLGDTARSTRLWNAIAADTEAPPTARAYAMYYMAKAAMEKQDLRRVFAYSQEALSLLLDTRGDKEKIKDTLLMSVYAAERSGRYQEALKWAREYDEYIPTDDPEWPAARFKLAQLYRKAGGIQRWREVMDDIVEKKPGTLYARLAKSAVETWELEQRADEFGPAVN